MSKNVKATHVVDTILLTVLCCIDSLLKNAETWNWIKLQKVESCITENTSLSYRNIDV